MRSPLAAAVAIALVAAPAGALAQQSRVLSYDGTNPFDCELQQAGFTADFPNPAADPFCVEYDKRRQNVSQGGVIQFLSLEPARVAQASPKCWYFQHDHWRGSFVQDQEATKTYEWDGSYFFDKARGLGGVYVENFNFNGRTGDPREMPGFPAEWKPHFGPGRGGVMMTDTVRADPRCVAKAKESPPPGPYRCVDEAGRVGRGLGRLRLGMRRADAEAVFGPPARTRGTMARWCHRQGGKFAAGFRRGRLVFALTTVPDFSTRGVAPRRPAGPARRRLRGARRVARRGSIAVLALERRDHRLLVGLDRRRVRFLATASRRLTAGQIARWLGLSR